MSSHHSSNNRDSFRRMNSASSRNSRGGGGGGRRGSYNRIDTSNFPTEQGIICSLKESFGFIHCAQRPDEIFFHYSEVQNEHPDKLQIDVEVEFKIGQSEKNPDKLAAYDVRTVPTGTVIWEIEDEPNKEYYGLVEKSARNYSDSNQRGGGGGGGPVVGTIRVVQLDENGLVVKTTTDADDDSTPQSNNDDQKNDPKNNQAKKQKELIRYRPDEYQPQEQEGQDEQENKPGSSSRRSSSGINSNRLFRGDLLKFRILLDRRTNQKYARYIALVKTEKERREEQLLANAVEEEGVIIALNKGYGFLKSNKRHEHVYFHFSNFPEAQAQQQQQQQQQQGGSSNNNTFSDVRKNDKKSGVLRKGQEVKFVVVTEESTNSNNSEPIKKVSARKLQSLPKGSVVFHKVIARGVKGVVTMIPQPPSTSTGDRGYADDKDGNIRLLHPMESIGGGDDDDEDYQNVKDVSLQFSDAPGGVYTFQQRGQAVNGLWIQQGDTLLFDVVQELADGSYRAAPTRHTIAVGGGIVPPKDVEGKSGGGGSSGKDNIEDGVIRLVSLSLIGRSEGTVHTIKLQAGYGFIHFAERPIDVHFSTYNVIPEELASDLRKGLGVDTGKRSVPLEMGASVQFDICAHGTVHSSGGVGRGGRNYGRGGGAGHNERENVKGHRILLLPPSTVKMDVLIASGVKGVVKSADTKQLYAGFVDLEEDNLQPMSEEDRHPLVAQLVTEFVEETKRPFGRESLVYHDVLSVKEDDVVVNILKSKANGELTYQHIPVAGFEAHPGRLCIRRADTAPVSDSVPTTDDVAAAGGGENTTDKENDGGIGGGEEDKASDDAESKPAKTKKDQKKPSKNLRFDKPCLSEECKGDIPPGPGDAIVCDIAQSRRTGKLLIHNMRIVERAKPEAGGTGGEEATLSSGIGVVKDVMINRNFGFISVYDENASNRELLFFQLSEVVKGNGGFGGKGLNKKSPVRKGDEVKFEICLDKNGKRVAKKVQIIAKGSIPSKESKNACKGFVLMEPSHSSLKDTPNRKSNRSPLRGRSKSPMRPSGGGGGGGGVASRWGGVDKDDLRQSKTQDIHEEGCILLLEDKIGMFTGKPTRRKRSKSVDDDARSVGSIDSLDSLDDLRSVGSTDGGTTSDEEDKVDILLNSHLSYKSGAIAIQGTGSSSIMDSKAAPRRGDLVSFVKSRKGKSIRDVRIVTRQAATLLRGRLENIECDATGKSGKAKFIAATEKEEMYEVNLMEVVSCAPGILKEKQSVEGILHEGRIYGICRTSDLYLESKLGTTHKQRPKLNLTVKKDRGGTVVAQSMMAKGPDNTIGFTAGWTTRKSQYASSHGE